jgi:ribosome-binding factor A
VYGDEREQDIALEGLKAKAKYVRMGLGKRMSLRMTPEVRFIKDESLERGSRVWLSLSLSLSLSVYVQLGISF